MTLVIDRNSFFDLGKCYIRKFISVARINECQTVLVSVLFSFSPSYVDQTTLAGPHLGSCSYLATSDTHIFAPLLLRALRCQTQDFSQRRPFLFFFLSLVFFLVTMLSGQKRTTCLLPQFESQLHKCPETSTGLECHTCRVSHNSVTQQHTRWVGHSAVYTVRTVHGNSGMF